MSLHYGATGTRTLCGRALSQRMELAPLWPEFLAAFEDNPDRCCGTCLRHARKWQRFSKDLAAANERRRHRLGFLPGEGS